MFGGRSLRSRIYSAADPEFFTIANHEQIVSDSLDINARLRPDIVILDEAQQIMMRMICDSPGIMKNNPSRDCPKLDELARILDDCLADPDVKVIIFSEWIGMLERVREWADRNRTGYAWHTGSVPQKQWRAEILAFRQNPDCRLFLSTDSGGVGLNLQSASVVINCDLPWNPAKLEQRIARAWRKNQLRPVTVVNLVAENTIEHGMLASLSQKMELAQGVLDGTGDLAEIKLESGRQALLKRLDLVMSAVPSEGSSATAPHADAAAHFASRTRAALGARLTQCDETWAPGSPTPILMVVLQDMADRPRIEELFRETEWRGDKPTHQILARTTWQALENLAAAGLISIHTRATRPLLPAQDAPVPPRLPRSSFSASKIFARSPPENVGVPRRFSPRRPTPCARVRILRRLKPTKFNREANGYCPYRPKRVYLPYPNRQERSHGPEPQA